MAEKAKLDIDRLYKLMMISKELIGYPKYKPLLDAAMAELEDMLPKEEEPKTEVKGYGTGYPR